MSDFLFSFSVLLFGGLQFHLSILICSTHMYRAPGIGAGDTAVNETKPSLGFISFHVHFCVVVRESGSDYDVV